MADLFTLFTRYLKQEENQIKFEKLKTKLETMVNKAKKKTTTRNR